MRFTSGARGLPWGVEVNFLAASKLGAGFLLA